jgi:ribosome recycling factor
MVDEVTKQARARMDGAVEALRSDLAAIRTGRASPALLERIRVDYYGTPTPLQQLATISVPEPNLLLIRPWDRSLLGAIERSILASDLGLTPMNDGQVIRLALPPLSEERRRELARQVAKRVEEAKVAVRNIRRDALNELKEMQNEKLITEDDFYEGRDKLQKLTDDYVKRLEEIGEQKQQELMEQ